MKDVITNILTSDSLREADAVEAALLSQAVATPWSSESV